VRLPAAGLKDQHRALAGHGSAKEVTTAAFILVMAAAPPSRQISWWHVPI